MSDMLHSMILRNGDTVALAAPARHVSPSEVEPAVSLLESWGLNVLLPEGLFEAENQFAGGDRHRADLFQRLLDDDGVKAIFCARGGYGSVRIVDRLDFSRYAARPKWIVGYSDITAIHSHMACATHLPSLHAIMPVNIPSDAVSSAYPALKALHELLFHGRLDYRFPNFTDNHSSPHWTSAPVANRVGECRAAVVGGNLSVLYSLLGSPSDVDTNGKILLIEDLDEYLYHVDRMMMAMRRAGKLSRLKGLIVGPFTDMHDNAIPFGRTAEQIVYDAVADFSYPVAFGCPFGHIGIDNYPLPFGVEVSLSVTADGCAIKL